MNQFTRSYGLEHHGFTNVGNVYWNLTAAALYEEAVRRREGVIAHLGPLVVRTGHHTGRSPNDKFVVRESTNADKIWWGKVNQPIEEDKFEGLYRRMLAYLQGRDLFVQDCYVGADPEYRIGIRVITQMAWHNLFARNLFIRIPHEELNQHVPEFVVIDAPGFHGEPEVDGTHTDVFIIVNFEKKLVLIGGTSYAGEIKKSVFTLMNFLLPQERVLSMHCSANMGDEGDTALFFGLSGTGKTTLSADPKRQLIGDDEHGWSEQGIFNFEGGCYAKVIKLRKESEPEIFECTRRFGTVLENVAYNSLTRRLDLDDASLTENTRAAYPLGYIANAVSSGIGGHPKNLIMLTADAFGVMPPVAKLTPDQAMYHFLSGYTAKVAGTEKGMGKEPQATFSTCFGAPFLALHPTVYAELLRDKIARYQVNCWLVNTGWIGGPYGVGERIKIAYTRAMVNAALEGKLDEAPTRVDSIFGIHVPTSCPDVPSEILDPRNTWEDPQAYDAKARDLAGQFQENFKQFTGPIADAVRTFGPMAG